MSALDSALSDYLALRRAMGFSLERDAKLLAQFVGYLDQEHSGVMSVQAALDWALLPAPASPGWLGYRMSVVRGFARYLNSIDPCVQVPPDGLLPGRAAHAVPYLYSDADIGALVEETRRLRTPLRAATLSTLIVLLRVTGMRIGEGIGLDDVDLDHGGHTLLIRSGKAGKTRLIPVHPTTTAALLDYQHQRDQVFPAAPPGALFVNSNGHRLLYVGVSVTFTKLVRRAGLTCPSRTGRPRIHDLRH